MLTSAEMPNEQSRVTDQIRFNDGAGYERYMGTWSRLAGDDFLDWLAPESGLRWLDVGCGNGAFTEMIVGPGYHFTDLRVALLDIIRDGAS